MEAPLVRAAGADLTMKPRLLIAELHHLGDAVLSLPFVRGAQRAFEVHVLCRPAARAVYELLEEPPKVHAWEPPWADGRDCPPRAALAAASTRGQVLSVLDFDTAVCVWADARAAILLGETRAARRIGFPMTRGNYYAPDIPWRRHRRWAGRVLETAWRIRHPRRPLLTDPLQRLSPGQSHLDCWTQVAAAAGVTCDFGTPWIKAPGPAAEWPDFRAPGRPVLAVHWQARVPSKQWPLERWRELLASPAVRERFSVLQLVPPGAAALPLEGAWAVDTPDLPSLSAALAAADAVVCHDSMPAHLAAALGKPVVAIFGSGEPAWFAPWNNAGLVVRKHACPLHPCIDRCGMDRHLCLEAVGVADVLAAIPSLPRP